MFRYACRKLLPAMTDDRSSPPTLVHIAIEGGTETKFITPNVPDIGLSMIYISHLPGATPQLLYKGTDPEGPNMF